MATATLDLISISASGEKMIWHENLGAGEFLPQRVIDLATDLTTHSQAVDMDGDGDLDVLSASRGHVNTMRVNTVAWHENQGGGVFSQRSGFDTDVDNDTDIHAADLDGDGDLDVLLASPDDDKVAWSENLGAGGFSRERIITTLAEQVQSVITVDMDGDGDLDILAASNFGRKRVLYENAGGGVFSSHQTLQSTDLHRSRFR